MATLFQQTQNQPRQNKAISPQFSAADIRVSQIAQGARESVISVAAASSQKIYAEIQSAVNKEPDLSPEDFTANYGEDGSFEYRAGETKRVADLRYAEKVKELTSQELTKGTGFMSNLVFGMVGNSVMDMPFLLMPAASILSKARAAKKGALANTALSESDALLHAIQSGSEGVFKSSMAMATKQATYGQLAEASTVYAGSQYIGRNYGVIDAILDVGLGKALQTGIAIPASMKASATAKFNAGVKADRIAAHNAMQVGNVQGVVQALSKYSRKLGLAIDADLEVSKIMDMDPVDYSKSPEAQAKLTEFFFNNEDAIWLNTMKGLIPLDTTVPVAQARAKQQAVYEEVVTAVDQGDFDNLSPEAAAVIDSADTKTQGVIDRVGPQTTDKPVMRAGKRGSKKAAKEAARLREVKGRITEILVEGEEFVDGDLPIDAGEQASRSEFGFEPEKGRDFDEMKALKEERARLEESLKKEAPSRRVAKKAAKAKAEPAPVSPPEQHAEAEAAAQDLDKDFEKTAKDGADAADAEQVEADKVVETEAAKYETQKQDLVAANTSRITNLLSGKFGEWATARWDDALEMAENLKIAMEGADIGEATALLGDIGKIKDRNIRARETGGNFLRDAKGSENHISPEDIGEEASRRAYQLKEDVIAGKMLPEEARQAYTKYLEERETSEILRELVDYHAIRQHDRKVPKGGKKALKYLKNWMDGLSRKGIDRGAASVQADRNAQIVKDQRKLVGVLAETKMLDLFDGNIMDLTKLPKELQSAYAGKERAELSEMFVEDLMYKSATGKVPEHWKGENQQTFDKIWSAWNDTTLAQVAQLNELGAGILLRDGHTGISQRWDNDTVIRKGWAEWHDDMLSNVDWVATAQAHGGRMGEEFDEFGRVTKWKPFDVEEFLTGWFEEITAVTKPMDHASMDIARSFSKSRMMHIKPEAEAKMMRKYSGHNSLGRLFQDQVRHRSEMIAMARNLGNKPIPNVDKMLARAGINENINTTRIGETRRDRLASKVGAADLVHRADVGHFKDTVKLMTGALDNPANHTMSFWGRSIRQLSHILYLPLSGVSAITDIPLTISTLHQVGGGTGTTAKLVTAMKDSTARRLKGDKTAMSNWLQGSGAAFDAIMNAGSRHLGLVDGTGGGNLLSKASEAMFSLNGLNQWTAIMQEAFTDVFTQSLGKQARTGKWDPHTLLTMESFGIKGKDLELLAAAVENIDGVDRLGANSVAGTDLEMKLLQMFSHFRDEAVMIPDPSTQAAVRFGTQAGTFWGEAARVLFQYQSFPLAMNRVTARKFLVNTKGESPWKSNQVTMARMTTYIGSMLALSYLATAIKDTGKLRQPMGPEDMSVATWLRVVNQSGMGGILQSMIEVGSGEPRAAIAPLPNTMWKMATADGFSEFAHQARPFYGANVPIVGQAMQTMLAYVFQDSLGEQFQQGRVFLEGEYGTDFYFQGPK